jgi:hypothetical protein
LESLIKFIAGLIITGGVDTGRLAQSVFRFDKVAAFFSRSSNQFRLEQGPLDLCA